MLLIDSDMQWQEGFAALGEVWTYAAQAGPRDHPALGHAEALVVRSVTPVDEGLLDAAPSLRVVASAAAGLDHIDRHACASRGVEVLSAAGHNASAVADWVWWAMHRVASSREWTLDGRRLGIIGCGHAGEAVAGRAAAHGMEVVRCDPPRHAAGTLSSHVPLGELLRSDVVSLHVPLTSAAESAHPTADLLNAERLRGFEGIVLNASRGGVLCPHAVRETPLASFALDVFPNEPTPSLELIQAATVATPHIAGSTRAAKREASAVLVRGLAEALGKRAPDPPGLSESSAVLPCPSLDAGVQSAMMHVLDEGTGLSEVERRFRSVRLTADRFRELRRISWRRAMQDVRIDGQGDSGRWAPLAARLAAHGVDFRA
jgi:erythronate-4-phosphate dehydrogenase